MAPATGAAVDLGRRVQALAVELAGTDPSPLERLLCEHVAGCWLDVALADLAFAAAVAQGSDPLGALADEDHQRRRDHTHRRFLDACATLAQVQRLSAVVSAAG